MAQRRGRTLHAMWSHMGVSHVRAESRIRVKTARKVTKFTIKISIFI